MPFNKSSAEINLNSTSSPDSSNEIPREQWKIDFEKEAEDFLKKRLVGQEHIVGTLMELVTMISNRPQMQVKDTVKKVLTFAGPSGVGKTTAGLHLAKVLTYYSALEQFYKNNIAGASKPRLKDTHGKELVVNIGSANNSTDLFQMQGYAGYDASKNAVNQDKVKKTIVMIGGRRVLFLILDEFPLPRERRGDALKQAACKDISNKLQALYDGKARWGDQDISEDVDDIYIIQTTNVGHDAVDAKIAENNNAPISNDQMKDIYRAELRNTIRADGSNAMVSRLNDGIYCFKALTEKNARSVVEYQIEHTLEEERSDMYGTFIHLPKKDLEFISAYVTRGYDQTEGVRPANKRAVDVLAPLSEEVGKVVKDKNDAIRKNMKAMGKMPQPNDLYEIHLAVKVFERPSAEGSSEMREVTDLAQYHKDLSNPDLSSDRFYDKYSVKVTVTMVPPRQHHAQQSTSSSKNKKSSRHKWT